MPTAPAFYITYPQRSFTAKIYLSRLLLFGGVMGAVRCCAYSLAQHKLWVMDGLSRGEEEPHRTSSLCVSYVVFVCIVAVLFGFCLQYSFDVWFCGLRSVLGVHVSTLNLFLCRMRSVCRWLMSLGVCLSLADCNALPTVMFDAYKKFQKSYRCINTAVIISYR